MVRNLHPFVPSIRMTTFFLVLGWALFAFALSFLLYGKTYYWLYPSRKEKEQEIGQLVAPALAGHFGNMSTGDLLILTREFPKRVHVELHDRLHSLLTNKQIVCSHGLELGYLEIIRMNDCLVQSSHRHVRLVPFTYKEIDIGEEEPVRCVKNGIWLWNENESPMALLLGAIGTPHDPSGLVIDIAVPKNSEAVAEAERILKQLEQAVKECATYRRKVLSLERQEYDYSGATSAINVHSLRQVTREQLILPEKTVALLERNVFGFARHRHELKALGLQTKKGLLFYGPPGTGKTHTLHYLIGQLREEYTTILITAEQVGYLDEYFAIARLLEPVIVIIEDVDIIGRNREEQSVCTESLLNKLLNEMDGLKEDADILFLLTTNHPEALETALRNRPGRIDQAIEFPLPDEPGREKLVRLYSCGLDLPPELTARLVKQTEGASAAFIKELLRRSAQYLLERDPQCRQLEQSDTEKAIDEMLHAGQFRALTIGDGDA